MKRYSVTYTVTLTHTTEIDAETPEELAHECARIYDKTEFSQYELCGNHSEEIREVPSCQQV